MEKVCPFAKAFGCRHFCKAVHSDILKEEFTKSDKKIKGKSSKPYISRHSIKFSKGEKMVALLLCYFGNDYYGMQRNSQPELKTIEGTLFKAMLEAGIISQDYHDEPKLIKFQRASRTDRGVSAVRQVVCLKAPLGTYEGSLVDDINRHLPNEIRVLAMKQVIKNFHCQRQASSRSYSYLLPTFAFAPLETPVTEEYRITKDRLDLLNEVLKKFEGKHNFYNFTSGRDYNDPACYRTITNCEAGSPFLKEGLEFLVIRIKGLSFILHQIRKILSFTIAIMRDLANVNSLNKAWRQYKLDIKKAPGLGLVLEEIYYDQYNKIHSGYGNLEPIVWDDYQEKINEFREQYIYKYIFETEKKEKSMLKWMSEMHFCTFDIFGEDFVVLKEQVGSNKMIASSLTDISSFDTPLYPKLIHAKKLVKEQNEDITSQSDKEELEYTSEESDSDTDELNSVTCKLKEQ